MARWIWKQGGLENCQGVPYSVKWDLQSVNTCPENFVWNQVNGTGSAIEIEAPGLYEVTMAFFSKKKKPLV